MVDKYAIAQLLKDPIAGEGTGPMRGDRMLMYLDPRGVPTIGYGRNLRDNGVSQQEAEAMLDADIISAEQECLTSFPFWLSLPRDAQTVMVCLTFNMGIVNLLGFHHMIDYLSKGNFPKAADHLLQSLWAHQVQPARRDLMVSMLRDCD